MPKKLSLSQWFTTTTLSIYLIVREQQRIPPLWQLPKEHFLPCAAFWVVTCAWVPLGSLQEQRRGPQRPGTPGASAARGTRRGWFYGGASEGKAGSLSVQGLQWPFLGLSARVNDTEKAVLQGNANQEELFSMNVEGNDIHFPENTLWNTKIPQNICPLAYSFTDLHSVLQLGAGFPCTLKYWVSLRDPRDRKEGSSPRYSPSFASSQMSSTSEEKERKDKLEKEMKTEAKMLPSESRLTGNFPTFLFHLSL